MPDLGIAFSPTNSASAGSSYGQGGTKPGASPVSPVQDAIKLLSLRLPTVLGAAAITPAQNLAGPTPFGTQLGSAIAENFLRRLFAGGSGPFAAPAPTPFGSTAPDGGSPLLPASGSPPVSVTPARDPIAPPQAPVQEPPSDVPPPTAVGAPGAGPGGHGPQIRQY